MSKWPIVSNTKLSPTLRVTEYTQHGFWIWDETRGINLAMRAKTRDEAFMEALTYYQKRLAEMERAYGDLRGLVDTFVSQVSPQEEEE